MINSKEIAQRAADLMAESTRLKELFGDQKINDFTESTGFCDDADLIGEDAIRQIGALTRRCSHLRSRIERHYSSNK